MRRSPPRALDLFFVYHPAPWVDRNWARLTGLPLEDVRFSASDGARLFGWFVPAAQPGPTLIWCHGNAGNIINRLDNLAVLHAWGFSVFLFDYRGYGLSEGIPTEEGLYRDAEAAYVHATAERGIAPSRLVIFGRSLGAAVAGELAGARPAAGLIVESSFPSVKVLARSLYYGFPADWFLRAKFALADRLKTVHLPLLVIHGSRDELVPLAMGRQVFEAAHPPKDFYVIDGAGHNDTYVVGGRAYFQRLRDFAREVMR